MGILVFLCLRALARKSAEFDETPFQAFISLLAVPKGMVFMINNSFFGTCVKVLQLCKMEVTEVFYDKTMSIVHDAAVQWIELKYGRVSI